MTTGVEHLSTLLVRGRQYSSTGTSTPTLHWHRRYAGSHRVHVLPELLAQQLLVHSIL
ncbi:MAG: hypothetical protein ACTSRC_14820 [Candidatus Helarchaeota archaeon]